MQKCCDKRATTAQSLRHSLLIQRRYEEPQLDGRKFTEALVDVPLLPLQKNPGRHLVPIGSHEMQATANGAEFGVGLGFEVDVPALIAPFELAHVLGALDTREGLRHTHECNVLTTK